MQTVWLENGQIDIFQKRHTDGQQHTHEKNAPHH